MSQEIRLLPFQMNTAFHARTMPEALSVLGIGLALLLPIFPGSNAEPVVAGYNWLTGLLAILLMFAMEENLRRALLINNDSWSFLWERPLTLGILSLAALVLVVPIPTRLVGRWRRGTSRREDKRR